MADVLSYKFILVSSSSSAFVHYRSSMFPCSDKLNFPFRKMTRRQLYVFGCTGDGQLGFRPASDDDSGTVRTPQVVFGAPTGQHGVAVKAIASGERHTLFLADDGKVFSPYLLSINIYSVTSAFSQEKKSTFIV